MFFINRELFVLKGLPYEKIRRKNWRKKFVKNLQTVFFLISNPDSRMVNQSDKVGEPLTTLDG